MTILSFYPLVNMDYKDIKSGQDFEPKEMMEIYHSLLPSATGINYHEHFETIAEDIEAATGLYVLFDPEHGTTFVVDRRELIEAAIHWLEGFVRIDRVTRSLEYEPDPLELAQIEQFFKYQLGMTNNTYNVLSEEMPIVTGVLRSIALPKRPN